MASGNFDINTPKVRPGTYINFKAKKSYAPSNATRGVCVVPLVGYDWGPNGTFVKITPEAPDAEFVKLGRSVYADDGKTVMLRLALYNSFVVYAYIISGGTAATGTQGELTATAVYPGTRGNDIIITSVANTDGGFDVSLYLGDELMEKTEGVKTIEELIAKGSSYVVYSGSGELEAFAGLALTGGEAAGSTNEEFTKFLDRLEKISFNTASIPVTDNALLAAAASKVKYLRNQAGKPVQFVLPGYSADDIGVINVGNSFALDGTDLTVAEATAWVAGATAGASKTESNTYKTVTDATAVVGELSNEETIAAINAGKFVFSTDDEGNVIVEYDINSLVNPDSNQSDTYKKNRVIRVLDSLASDLQDTFPPNKFSNDDDGWAIMQGLGVSLLESYETDGAITNVDAEADFLVDQTRSVGDATYFDVAVQPVDSAEKLYFSVSTQ
jgi:hypothetical protein